MFDYYINTYKGKLSQDVFEATVPWAQDTLKIIAGRIVPFWRLSSIDFNSDVELFRALCIQVDYINAQGGVSALIAAGSSPSLAEVSTEGFKYTYGKSSASTIEGVSISPFAQSEITRVLRQKGLTFTGVEL